MITLPQAIDDLLASADQEGCTLGFTVVSQAALDQLVKLAGADLKESLQREVSRLLNEMYAGPVLFKALTGLVEWCEDNFCGEPSGPDLSTARAAIAKAEKPR